MESQIWQAFPLPLYPMLDCFPTMHLYLSCKSFQPEMNRSNRLVLSLTRSQSCCDMLVTGVLWQGKSSWSNVPPSQNFPFAGDFNARPPLCLWYPPSVSLIPNQTFIQVETNWKKHFLISQGINNFLQRIFFNRWILTSWSHMSMKRLKTESHISIYAHLSCL